MTDGTSTRLAKSAGLIGVATVTSRVLGLIRDQLLAHLFGAGHAMDAFNVASRIPNVFRDLFAEGAMSAAFVPSFTRRVTQDSRAEAWRLGNQVMNALLVITVAVAAVGMAFAGPIAWAFAKEYAAVPGKLPLTVQLTRVLFPVLPLFLVAAVCMGMLNSLHRFFVPSLSPATFNVAMIACALGLVPVMPFLGLPPIMAIAIGSLLGGLAQVALQWPRLRQEGFRYQFVLDWRDPALREVLVLMGPGLVGLAAVQINLFVNTVLATRQDGAVSWLNYAFRLMYLPIGLFGVSVATAALPSMSRQAADRDLAGMRRTISSGLRMMLMLNVPATAGLITLAWPIVALIFQHGSFTRADADATSLALACYAPGLIGYSAVRLVAPAFYALHDSRTPVTVSVVSVGLNVVLNLALVRLLGYRGLALGTAVAALFNAGLLISLLRRRLGGIDESRLAWTFGKIVVASLVMALVTWRLDVLLAGAMSDVQASMLRTILVRLIRVTTDIGAALLVLALTAHLLRLQELHDAIRVVRARLAGPEQE